MAKRSRSNSSTIRSTADFARYVGLARTTVSRVLNGHPDVKRKTVEKVQRALEETGFAPNAFAAHLRGKSMNVVGVCMENLLTPPMVAKLAALQRRLRGRGFSSLIEVFEPGASRKLVQHFQAMQATAVAFIGHFPPDELTERVAELRERGLAHVLIDQTGITNANTVSVDRIAAMRQAMQHLLGLGHRRFGVLGMNGAFQSIRDRWRGIADELAAHDLDVATCTVSLDHLETRENDFAFGRALAGAFVRQDNRPTAYLAVNDEVAIGAMLGFQNAGLNVPRDVSVVGFNNQEICQMTAPSITSVDQQINETIAAAADVLHVQLAQPTEKRITRLIPPVFVPRGSTGPARNG